MKTDWTGEYYLGMTLKWDYNKIHNDRSVCLSMPGYVRDALIQFQHTYTKNTFAPSPYQTPVYGQKQQMAPIIETPTLSRHQ